MKRHEGMGGYGVWRGAGAAAVLGALLAGLPLAVAAGAARADDGGLGTVERLAPGMGTSTDWRQVVARTSAAADDQPGGVPDEFGAGRRPRDERPTAASSGRLGRQFKAGLLSAVLPGAGQYYNGSRRHAYMMAGVEAGIWTAYFVFDRQGDNRMESAREWAGIYAHTSGDHPESYWQAVGQYESAHDYNDSRRREARALQEPVSGLVPEDDWRWDNDDRRSGYAKLRADGNAAHDRRDFMILFAVLNRAVSVFDAVIGAGKVADATHARVLGLDVDLALQPALTDPGARCVVSRRF